MLPACDAIYDDEGDCSVTYQVRFIDDMNLLFTDAFAQEVTSVSLYVFDENNKLVWSKMQSRDELEYVDGGYAMNLDALSPGRYHLVAWGGVDEDDSFRVSDLKVGDTIDKLTCSLKDNTRAVEASVVSDDLTPLFHGMTDIIIPEAEVEGTLKFQMQLTQNTNRVSVMLQQLNGENLQADDYEFTVEADNGHFNYDNSLIYDRQPFIYEAWSKQAGYAGVGSSATTVEKNTVSQVSVLVGYMTISRMVADTAGLSSSPLLVIRKKTDGEALLTIPLVDYALLIKRNYNGVTSDQDYLDRQHDYNIIFFVNNDALVTGQIVINSWRIVWNNDDFS
jgi:hypothetical protein